jgi:hypothetical protein
MAAEILIATSGEIVLNIIIVKPIKVMKKPIPSPTENLRLS